MRHPTTTTRILGLATAILLLWVGMAALVHSTQHPDSDADCLVCLAHTGSPALVREVVRVEEPSCVKCRRVSFQDSVRHAGHGSPRSSRAPPFFQV